MDSAWERYRASVKETVKHDLGQFNMPEFWIEIKNISALTTVEISNMIEQANKVQLDRSERYAIALEKLGDELEENSISSEDFNEQLVQLNEQREYSPDLDDAPRISPQNEFLISNWNLTSLTDGESLPLPLNDPWVMKHLPAEIVIWIDEKIDEQWAGFSGPKATESTLRRILREATKTGSLPNPQGGSQP